MKVLILHVMWWNFNNKNATETAQEISSVYGRGVITDCQTEN